MTREPDDVDQLSRVLRHHLDEAERERARCAECDLPIGAAGGWYVDADGDVRPYCLSCAGLEFPLV